MEERLLSFLLPAKGKDEGREDEKGVLLSVRSSKVEVEAQGRCALFEEGDKGETGDIAVFLLEEMSEGGRVVYGCDGFEYAAFACAGSWTFWGRVVYAAFVGGKRVSDDGDASLSLNAVVRDFFFLWRRSRRMKIPIRARAITPPTATPAIRAVEGPEDLEEDAAAAVVDDDGS